MISSVYAFSRTFREICCFIKYFYSSRRPLSPCNISAKIPIRNDWNQDKRFTYLLSKFGFTPHFRYKSVTMRLNYSDQVTIEIHVTEWYIKLILSGHTRVLRWRYDDMSGEFNHMLLLLLLMTLFGNFCCVTSNFQNETLNLCLWIAIDLYS